MNNVYLLKDDGTILHTTKSPIMEKTNNIDNIDFVCSKTYNDLDMSEFDLVLTYKLPISHSVKIVTLELVDDGYKDSYLLYRLPVTAKLIASEAGDVLMTFMQAKVELNSDSGEQTKYVKNYEESILPIIPITNYLNVDDSGLNQLAEMYLANKAQIEAIKELADQIYAEKGDDIVLDTDNGTLQLSSNGELIGTGVELRTLNGELVEVGAETDGNIKIVDI